MQFQPEQTPEQTPEQAVEIITEHEQAVEIITEHEQAVEIITEAVEIITEAVEIITEPLPETIPTATFTFKNLRKQIRKIYKGELGSSLIERLRHVNRPFIIETIFTFSNISNIINYRSYNIELNIPLIRKKLSNYCVLFTNKELFIIFEGCLLCFYKHPFIPLVSPSLINLTELKEKLTLIITDTPETPGFLISSSYKARYLRERIKVLESFNIDFISTCILNNSNIKDILRGVCFSAHLDITNVRYELSMYQSYKKHNNKFTEDDLLLILEAMILCIITPK
jgi:hypothetical protein